MTDSDTEIKGAAMIVDVGKEMDGMVREHVNVPEANIADGDAARLARMMRGEYTEQEASDRLIAALQHKNAELRDQLIVARRRIRVLRGKDTLTTASSHGVVMWLRAIVKCTDMANVADTKTHLNALIETLEGNE